MEHGRLLDAITPSCTLDGSAPSAPKTVVTSGAMPFRPARCVHRPGPFALFSPCPSPRWPPSSAVLDGGVSPARTRTLIRAAPRRSSRRASTRENLWPHAGPQRFATVGGVETVEPGKFGFALVTDYQSRPITFNVPAPGPGGTAQYAIDNQVNGNFLWAVGVTRRLELDVALPVTFGQDGSGAAPITGSNVQLHDTAMRDLRFGAAVQIVPRTALAPNGAFGLTARFEVSAPTGDRDQYAGDATAVFVPSLAADYRNGRFFAGLEVGGRIRPDAQVLGQNVGPQATAALGIGYDLLPRTKLLGVMVEARALPTFASQYVATGPSGAETTSSTMLVPAEWMLALRSSPLASDDVSITLGGGGGLASGEVTEPRFRFLLGLRYAPTGIRRPAEGREAAAGSDAEARPRLQAGSLQGRPRLGRRLQGRRRFCPDEDTDHDGIDDRYDRCPLEAEDFAGLTEGCPEPKPAASPLRKPHLSPTRI